MSNEISITIPKQVLDDVLASLTTARTKLAPYLQALTPDERQGILKMKDKSVAFVSSSLDYAESNPEFAPPYLDVPELKKDVKAVTDLNPIEQQAAQLLSLVDDTIMLAGSEAFTAALTYYNSVKTAAKRNVPGAKPIYDDLKVRFEKTSKKKTNESK